MPSYGLIAIPAAHAPAMNRVINTYNNDVRGVLDAGDSLTQRLSASGNEPATWLAGGDWMSADTLAFYHGLPESGFSPPGGWPLAGGTTQEQAEAAFAAIRVCACTGADYVGLSQSAMDVLYADLGVQIIEGPS